MTLFWWGLCLDNSPLSKFVSLPVLPAPPSLPPPLLSSYFINGSSWRSFSGIQGLLSFGVLMSCDAWNTTKTLLETVAIQAGARGPVRGPDGRAQAVVPQDAQSPAEPRSRESVGPRAEPVKQPVDDEFLCSQFFPRFLIPLLPWVAGFESVTSQCSHHRGHMVQGLSEPTWWGAPHPPTVETLKWSDVDLIC